MTMECSGKTYTRMPRVSERIPDSRVDFHRCGNNFGAAVVSMPEVSHKRSPRWRVCESSDPSSLRRLGDDVAGTGIGLAPDQIPGAHAPFPLDFDVAPLLQHEIVFQSSINVLGHLNPADRVGGFHPRCDVHRVAPYVVEESARPDDAGDDGP